MRRQGLADIIGISRVVRVTLQLVASKRSCASWIETRRAKAARAAKVLPRSNAFSRAHSPQSRSAMHGWASKTIYTSASAANRPQSEASGYAHTHTQICTLHVGLKYFFHCFNSRQKTFSGWQKVENTVKNKDLHAIFNQFSFQHFNYFTNQYIKNYLHDDDKISC